MSPTRATIESAPAGSARSTASPPAPARKRRWPSGPSRIVELALTLTPCPPGSWVCRFTTTGREVVGCDAPQQERGAVGVSADGPLAVVAVVAGDVSSEERHVRSVSHANRNARRPGGAPQPRGARPRQRGAVDERSIESAARTAAQDHGRRHDDLEAERRGVDFIEGGERDRPVATPPTGVTSVPSSTTTSGVAPRHSKNPNSRLDEPSTRSLEKTTRPRSSMESLGPIARGEDAAPTARRWPRRPEWRRSRASSQRSRPRQSQAALRQS